MERFFYLVENYFPKHISLLSASLKKQKQNKMFLVIMEMNPCLNS